MPPRKPEMGKFLLYKFFSRNPEISKHLPSTARYSRASLEDYVQKYDAVYVKPVAGSMGRGILKVQKSNGQYVVQKNVLKARKLKTFNEVVRYIDMERAGKMYIVQQGIALAKLNGRPFDIRVMMQRNQPGGPWIYAGSVAKIAGGHSIVTNVALSRGNVMDVETALRKSFGWSKDKARRVIAQLKHLGQVGAAHFDTYQKYRELGFDVAVDVSGRVWMIEQNTAPSHKLFQHLHTHPVLFNQIQYRYGQYARAMRKAK